MMSNALEDEDRFRGYIDAAITAGEVQGFDAYVNEAKKTGKARKKGAEREKAEAIEHAKELGIYESLFGNGKPKGGGQQGLAGLIQQRQKHRATSFLDDLETKYGGKSAVNGKTNGQKRKANDEPPVEVSKTNGTRHKRRKAVEVVDESSEEDEQNEASDEPSEEAFQAMAARTQKASYVKPAAEDSDAEESLGDEDTEEEEDEQEEEETLEEKPKPAKKATRNGQTQRRGANTKRHSGGRK